MCELFTQLTDPKTGELLWGTVGPHEISFLNTSNYLVEEKRYFHGYQYGYTYDENVFQLSLNPKHMGS